MMISIKLKLIFFVGLLFVAICGCLSYISYTNASQVLEEATENSLINVSEQSASLVSATMKGDLKEMEAVAARADLVSSSVTQDEKIKILYNEAQRVGCQRMTYIYLDGNSFNGNGKLQNNGDREYFLKAKAGTSFISDPTIGKSTGDLLVFYAVPIYSDGEIIAVLQSVNDGTKLSELSNSVSYGETGRAYMVSVDGTIIAHQDNEVVMNSTNIITLAEEDESYADYAKAIETVLKNKNGFTSYIINGETKYLGYSQVEGTTWELIVEVDASEIMAGVEDLKAMTIKSSAVFIIVGLIITYLIAATIAGSIKYTSKKLEKLASGDLTDLEYKKRYLRKLDEVGRMTRAMQDMNQTLASTISEIKSSSINIDKQSETLARTADGISNVSQNVADSISGIARGTAEQTEGIVMISSIMNDFGSSVGKMVTEIRDVNDTSNEINDKAAESSAEMKDISASVEKVSETFESFRKKIDELDNNVNSIGQFIGVINQIAKQTNLLALNASIEAARAGTAGKGFAVVADEIRGLAKQTADSSEQISQLLTGISQDTSTIVVESNNMNTELNSQSEVIKKSIETFNDIISAIEIVLPKIGVVESSVTDLDEKKGVIMENVNNISSVAQNVSASAEEIAASAEEMNASITEMAGIAESLKNRSKEMNESVSEFKVK